MCRLHRKISNAYIISGVRCQNPVSGRSDSFWNLFVGVALWTRQAAFSFKIRGCRLISLPTSGWRVFSKVSVITQYIEYLEIRLKIRTNDTWYWGTSGKCSNYGRPWGKSSRRDSSELTSGRLNYPSSLDQRISNTLWGRFPASIGKTNRSLRSYSFKGTVARDFWPLVFSTNRPHIVPEFTP
jgi:hypothetical protein